MKLHFSKLIICIVMLSVLLLPATVQGMPDTNHDESSITTASSISPGDTTFSVNPSAISHTIEIKH